jgi:hypothetical protein
MIFVITPLVKVAGMRSVVRAAVYAGSLVFAAVLLGVTLALAGRSLLASPPTLLACIAGTLACVLAAREIGLLRLPLPSSSYQVPREWLAKGVYGHASLYGLLIGLGFVTRAPFATFHLLLAWYVLLGDAMLAAAAGLVYGLARAGVVFAAALYKGGAPMTSLAWRLIERQSFLHVANALALAYVGGVILAAALL